MTKHEYEIGIKVRDNRIAELEEELAWMRLDAQEIHNIYFKICPDWASNGSLAFEVNNIIRKLKENNNG